MRPSYTRSAPSAQDHAAVVTTAILQIVRTDFLAWFSGDDVSFSDTRAAIEATLREHEDEIKRQARDGN
jgi:hypothetical protein